jgi:hypothetical protein
MEYNGITSDSSSSNSIVLVMMQAENLDGLYSRFSLVRHDCSHPAISRRA